MLNKALKLLRLSPQNLRNSDTSPMLIRESIRPSSQNDGPGLPRLSKETTAPASSPGVHGTTSPSCGGFGLLPAFLRHALRSACRKGERISLASPEHDGLEGEPSPHIEHGTTLSYSRHPPPCGLAGNFGCKACRRRPCGRGPGACPVQRPR